MVSAIDFSRPLDGVPAVKSDLRNNLQTAHGEITALQATKSAVNVDEFGAVGDGVANDSAAIQAAIDASNYVVFTPGNTYLCEEIRLDGDFKRIDSRGSTIINAGNGNDLFILSSVQQLDRAVLSFGNLDTGLNGGHIFSMRGNILHSIIEGQQFICRPDTSSIFDRQAGAIYFVVFQGGWWRMPTTSTVHGVNIVGDNNLCSAVTFQNFRADRCGLHFFNLECTAPTNSFYSIRFRDIDFEVTNDGAIRLRGCARVTIASCFLFDVTAPVANMIDISRVTTPAIGKFCEGILIESLQRNSGGTLSAGIFDVQVSGLSRDITMINCSGVNAAGSLQIDLGNAQAQVISSRFCDIINDEDAVIIDNGSIKTGYSDTASRPDATVVGIGGVRFDTTLGRQIVSNGTDWTDGQGNVI